VHAALPPTPTEAADRFHPDAGRVSLFHGPLSIPTPCLALCRRAVRHGLHRVLQLSDPALWSLARHERRADWDACRRALRCGSIAASCSSIAAASNRARTKVRGGSLFTTGGFQDTTVIAGRDLLSRVPQSKGPFSCDQWGSIIIAGAGCRTKLVREAMPYTAPALLHLEGHHRLPGIRRPANQIARRDLARRASLCL
jgi:hypothetical protein